VEDAPPAKSKAKQKQKPQQKQPSKPQRPAQSKQKSKTKVEKQVEEEPEEEGTESAPVEYPQAGGGREKFQPAGSKGTIGMDLKDKVRHRVAQQGKGE